MQLPATVISTRAQEKGYDCSLFKRLQVLAWAALACMGCACMDLRELALHGLWRLALQETMHLGTT